MMMCLPFCLMRAIHLPVSRLLTPRYCEDHCLTSAAELTAAGEVVGPAGGGGSGGGSGGSGGGVGGSDEKLAEAHAEGPHARPSAQL